MNSTDSRIIMFEICTLLCCVFILSRDQMSSCCEANSLCFLRMDIYIYIFFFYVCDFHLLQAFGRGPCHIIGAMAASVTVISHIRSLPHTTHLGRVPFQVLHPLELTSNG